MRAWAQEGAASTSARAGAARFPGTGPAAAQPQGRVEAAMMSAAEPDPARLRAALSKQEAYSLAIAAQACIRELPKPSSTGSAARAAEAHRDCWRLVPDIVRTCCSGLSSCKPSDVANVLVMKDPLLGILCTNGALPAAPPPSFAAALEGGLLGCLELLLRGTVQNPKAPHAQIVHRLCELCDIQDGKLVGCSLVPSALLAYGDPRRAASLVASLAKVCLYADRVETAHAPSAASGTFLFLALCLLYKVAAAMRKTSAKALSGPMATEAAEAEEGGQEQDVRSPSAPELQLAGVVSYAARLMLPMLARLAAIEVAVMLAHKGAADLPITAVAPVVHWLPVLAYLAVSAEFAGTSDLASSEGQGAVQRRGAAPGAQREPALLSQSAAAAVVTSDSGSGGGDNAPAAGPGSGGNAWRPLLRQNGPLLASLCGGLLHLGPRCPAVGDWNAPSLPEVAAACVAVAAACPAEVRAAAADAAAQTGAASRGPAAMGGGGSRRLGRSGGRGMRGASGAGRLPDWHPQCARALLPGLRAAGHGAMAAAAEALAAQLERWSRGGGTGT